MSRMRMPVAFVVGPYRSDTHRGVVLNIRAAEDVAVQLWQLGFAVICPHTNSGLLSGVVDEARFVAGYHELMRRADLLVITEGFEASAGSRDEVIMAAKFDRPVVRWEWEPALVGGQAAPSVDCDGRLTLFLARYRQQQIEVAKAARAAEGIG